LLILFATVFFYSCASTTIRDTTDITADTSIGFGHVDVFVDGKKKEWGMTWTGEDALLLLILPPDTNKALTYQLSDDGDFFWNLNPGEYTVLGYRMLLGSRSRSGRLWYSFKVPTEPQSIYLGKIRIDMQGGRYKAHLEDDFNSMETLFEQRYPNAKQPTKGLFRTEETLGNYNYVKPVCSADWGIECTSRYRGVEPISPEMIIDGFPVATNLTPTFKWKPSVYSRVTYDLVVYEAASHSSTLIPADYTPGRLALYEEDINQPQFIPRTPLKPETKYYWSVRLRDGDLVSDWSSFSYAVFVVVYAASGQGNWFGFSTP